MSTIEIEMKFKLTFSSVLLVAVALGACGGADESRTRNAAAPECRAPGTGPTSEAFLRTTMDEIYELRSIHEQKTAAVETAKQVLEDARANVPLDLRRAVARFHANQAVLDKIQKRVEELPAMGLSGNDLEDALEFYAKSIQKYETDKDQEGMNALLVKRAAQLNELVEAHTKAVKEADEAFAAYQQKIAARDEVIAFAALPECVSGPILSAGDAEAEVQQVAENVPTTSTTERPVYQFFDEPMVNPVEETKPSTEDTQPTTEETQPITEQTASTSSVPSYVYEPPTAEQILKAVIEDVDSTSTTSTTSTSMPPETEVVVEELQTLVDRVIDDVQSSPETNNEAAAQTGIQEQAAEKVVAIGTFSQSPTESTTDASKAPVKVFAAGFSPNSTVIVSARDGSPLATTTASEGGIVDIEVIMPTSEENSKRSLVIAGTNQEGKKIALPIVVDTEVGTTTTEPTSTTETADSSSWLSIRMFLLAFLLLLFLAWLVQTRRKKSA